MPSQAQSNLGTGIFNGSPKVEKVTEKEEPIYGSLWRPENYRHEWREATNEIKPKAREEEPRTPKVCRNDFKNAHETEEMGEEEEPCEIVLTSKKVYTNNSSGDMKLGYGETRHEYFAPTSGAPMKLYINGIPDLFQNVEKYCKDELLLEPTEPQRYQPEHALIVKISTKSVRQLDVAQYEVITKTKFYVPKSANVTFLVRACSDTV